MFKAVYEHQHAQKCHLYGVNVAINHLTDARKKEQLQFCMQIHYRSKVWDWCVGGKENFAIIYSL